MERDTCRRRLGCNASYIGEEATVEFALTGLRNKSDALVEVSRVVGNTYALVEVSRLVGNTYALMEVSRLVGNAI